MNQQQKGTTMSERRYYDLFAEISRMMMPQDERVGIAIALHWLDRHPDQVPGRTITESEFHEVADAHRNGGLGWRDLADSLGITVVPDPEPTNLDWLKKFMTEIQKDGMSPDSAAEWLDARGVRAGSDD